MLAIRFYDVVVAVHVLGVVFAFGVIFAYPVLVGYVKRHQPYAMAALHAAQDQIGRKVITPGMIVVLVAGVYLASDIEAWDRPWVSGPLVILFVLFGLGGAFFSPQERKLADLAQRDIAAAEGTTVEFSAEYEALYERVKLVAFGAIGLVTLAVFLMVTKPGGY
jgi:uncharacterized membrane protein